MTTKILIVNLGPMPVSIAATIAENLTQIGGTAVGVGNPLYIAPGTGATFVVNGTFWQRGEI